MVGTFYFYLSRRLRVLVYDIASLIQHFLFFPYIIYITSTAGDSDISRWKDTNEIYENSVNVGEGGTTCRQWVKRIGNTVDISTRRRQLLYWYVEKTI